MRGAALFSKKMVALLAGLGTVSFILVIVLTIFLGDPKYAGTFGADSFSTSAIGHKALYQSLRTLGFNVLQSQNRTVDKVTTNSLLLVMEPGVNPERKDELSAMLATGNVLLVLPKRAGFPTGLNRRWIDIAGRVDQGRIKAILDALPGANFSDEKSASIVLEGEDTKWQPDGQKLGLEIQDPQTINWSRLIPLIWNQEGTLLGKLDVAGKSLFVLADPDVLQNHGIGKGNNAAFVYSLISQLGGGRDVIIIDETAHGHILSPSLLASAFTPPFLYPVLFLLAGVLILIWATSGRFSPPRDEPEAMTRDKRPLIQNISNLLSFGGHYGTVTERYYAETLKAVAERMNAPAGLHGMDLIRWIDTKNETRGLPEKFENIRRRALHSIIGDHADLPRQLKLARDAFQWKEEVLNGTGKNKKAE